MNRPASEASLTARHIQVDEPLQKRSGAPTPEPYHNGSLGRAKFEEVASLRMKELLHRLDILNQLADNAHRYVVYESDFLEIEMAVLNSMDRIMKAFRKRSRKPEFKLSGPE
jgi:hypothetical protein